MQKESTYQYTSAPQAVQTHAHFRAPGWKSALPVLALWSVLSAALFFSSPQRGYGNMMYDFRIRRGNTYSPHPGPIVCVFPSSRSLPLTFFFVNSNSCALIHTQDAAEETSQLRKATMTRKRQTLKREEVSFDQTDSQSTAVPGRVNLGFSFARSLLCVVSIYHILCLVG
jgi:hypothetical protein